MAGEIFQHQAYEYKQQIADPAERAFFEEVFRRCACANFTGACVFSEPQENEGVRFMTASVQGPYGGSHTLWIDGGKGTRLVAISETPIGNPHVARGYECTDDVVVLYTLDREIKTHSVGTSGVIKRAAASHMHFLETLEQRLIN